MTVGALRERDGAPVDRASAAILDALPHPVILVRADGLIEDANTAAQSFFQASINVLRRHPLE